MTHGKKNVCGATSGAFSQYHKKGRRSSVVAHRSSIRTSQKGPRQTRRPPPRGGWAGGAGRAMQQATALPAPAEPAPRRPEGRGRPQVWHSGQWGRGKAAELRGPRSGAIKICALAHLIYLLYSLVNCLFQGGKPP